MNQRPEQQPSEPRVIAITATVTHSPLTMLGAILASLSYIAYVLLVLLS